MPITAKLLCLNGSRTVIFTWNRN